MVETEMTLSNSSQSIITAAKKGETYQSNQRQNDDAVGVFDKQIQNGGLLLNTTACGLNSYECNRAHALVIGFARDN